MADGNQLSFGDGLLSSRRKMSKFFKHLYKLDQIFDWKPLVGEVSIIGETDVYTCASSRKYPQWMVKATFLQTLFSLWDPQLEVQLIDRLSFQRFLGLYLDLEIPDFTTFWRFKKAMTHNLDQRIFELINQQLEQKCMLVKNGAIVDASILPSLGRLLSDKKCSELEQTPSSQIDIDDDSTKKSCTYCFGSKGHIGVEMESKLISKASFTLASFHDSTQTEKLVIYDEKAFFEDKTFADGHHKYSAHHYGWYYGVLDKTKCNQPLSGSQKKRNHKLSSIRTAIELPFAWMKIKPAL